MGNKIVKKNVEDIFALTPLQQGMLFHYLKDTGSSEYIEQLSLRLRGIINAGSVKRAWDHVVQCNEMLRTVYKWEKLETPIQVVQREHEVPVRYVEIKEKDEAEKLIEEIREKDKAEGIDISVEPFRVTIVKLSEDEGEMIITNHHILYDGWSSGIIVKEFIEAYESILDGKEPVKRVKPRFKEYVKWQQGQNKEEQLGYWKSYLEGYEEKTVIAGYGSGEEKKEKTAIYHEELEQELKNAIEKVCREEEVTIATVINTAWGILLQRYNNTGDAVFGTTVSGRAARLEDIEETVGLYINTLPIRVKTEGKENIAELLRQVEQDARERESYESLALTEIQGAFGAGGGESLFDTLVVIENYPIDKRLIDREGKVEVQIGEVKEATNYDITVGVMVRDRIVLNISYKEDKYEIEKIRRLTEHLKNILWEISKNNRKPVKEIEMIGKNEKQQLLYEFNDTYAEYPKDKTIHELFEEQAARIPDNIAVVYEDSQLTYRELNEKANRLARVLRKKGVVPDSIVGIMVERSLEMIIGILGILKAGGAYLPIDPEYPADRIRYMLEDSGTGILLVQRQTRDKTTYEGEKIELGDERLYAEDSSNLEAFSRPNDLAYIIYTSGTTGKPKGVMVEHKGICNLNKLFSCRLEINETDRIMQFASISFDASVWEIFMAILCGGRLYVTSNDVILNNNNFGEFLEKNHITVCTLPPHYLEYIQNINVKHLRELISAGSALASTKMREWNSVTNLINAYGPTEASICSTMLECRGHQNISIGKPIQNAQIYILDRNSKLQPIGIAGELCIGGEGLARGYLGKPELTAEKFVDNPFLPGERMYKTGDFARWLPDGNIEYLGRMDHQIKIRGYRIELGEIESRLLEHEAIKEVVATIREDKNDKQICAYIIADKQITAAELREHMRLELPEYMMPSYFIQLDRMPLTPNGKIDRKALPEPDGSIVAGAEYAAPRNEIEEKLVKIWQGVLGIEKIGINDNFFDLGGHSLKATSMMSKIHKELSVEVPLKEIFRIPTIKGLSEYIKGHEENIYAAIETVEEKEYYGLSSAQKRLYTLQQFDLESTGYNISGVLEIEGKLAVERLEAAFRKLIERHEAFRTSFELIEEGIVQKIHKKVEFEVEHKEVGEGDAEEIIRSFIRPFDLSKAPLLRVGLIKLYSGKNILMFDMHHIISDGTSMGILTNEFVKLYEGQELSPLRLQYKDYAAWQNSMLNSEAMKRQEEYWLKTFEGEISVLNLSTDYPRPAIQSFEGGRIHFELEEEITEGLRRVAKETGSTMYMVLLSGFNILLSKYSGQEDIVVGSPIAGRPHADLEKIIGMFVNTLAMRNYPKCSKTVGEFIEEVRTNALSAYENQYYQFEELVEKLNVKRDMGRNPVFDVMFAMQNMDMGEIAIEGASVKPYDIENRISKFDITIEAVEAEEKLDIGIGYSTKLFSKETIERMAGHLTNVLRDIAQNTGRQISEIGVLGEEEKYKLLFEFNDTYAEYPRDKTIHELFEEQVDKTPDNIAVVYEDSQLTYRELNEKANQLARVLREKGVVPDSIVGIMVERSLEMIVGIMGILKAGGAYLPVDPEYPKDRIEYMLEDSRASILLTQKHLRGKTAFDGEVIELDSERLHAGDSSNLEAVNRSNDLAYVIYTSGSTGKPKGVMVEHKSISNTINWKMQKHSMGISDIVLPILSYTFDAFTSSLFITLNSGACIVILSNEDIRNPYVIVHNLKKNNVTHLVSTPAIYSTLLDNYEEDATLLLKAVTLGGDRISEDLVVKSKQKFKLAKIHNEYGPTENSVVTASKMDIKSGDSITIGKPISNTRIFILDKNNKIQPVGVAGELCVSGAGLARGYLNRPELTAEKFVENLFEPGMRMYRTGDLAKWLTDGNIEFLGRIDDQVKIRGYRIELGEIESQLLKHSDIKEAVVIAKEDENGSKYLCAYIAGEKKLVLGELREHLGKELPDYMIPAYFIQLEKLPLTPNGKIDRKALPEPDGSIATGTEYAAPRNEIEEKLVKIWQEVLGVDRIGINDNFFELGGHSLKATSMVAKIHKELNVEVPLREVFKTPAIKGLSEYMKVHEENIYAAIEPVEEKEYYGLSSAQKRLYTLQQFDLESTSYNIPGALEIRGKLDVIRIEFAFRKLIERHEALRTSFELIGEEIVQKIHEEAELEIEHKEAREEDVEEIIRSFIQPFDLSKAPLLRVGLIKVHPKKHILMYDMHHIISDGTSMGILVKEFAGLYEGKVLPELRLQYKDYAAWQNSMFNNGTMKKQEEHWLKEFEEEIPVLNLPTDYQRPAIQSFEGDSICFELSEGITRGLRKVTEETGATMYMVLLSGFNILLSKYSGQEDIVIGSPIAGRPHADLENILGMFVNTLAMRNYPEGRKTIIELIEEAKANALKAYENQNYQFEELVEKLNVRRDMSRNPVFDAMLVMQNTDMEEIAIEGISIKPYRIDNRISKFDITLIAVEAEEKIGLSIEYCNRLFKKETIERMVGHLKNVLIDMSENTGKRINEIELLDEEERHKLLYEFNDTYAEYPKDKTIHELFEEQVEKTPDNIAVMYGDKQLTYRELNEKSNQLARVLREKRVVPDSIVGIMLERSLEMMVGIMGILKAGGAYLPIDPEYPMDRIEYMLQDSGAKLLLTQANLLNKLSLGCETFILEEDKFISEDVSNLERSSSSNDLIYIIYTSGSTGKPKGVMLSHKGVVNYINWAIKSYIGNECYSFPLFTSVSFDLTVTSIYTPLITGNRLIIYKDDEKQLLIEKVIESNAVQIVKLTPAHLQLIKGKDCSKSGIKRIIVGGDQLICQLVKEIQHNFGNDCEIFNEYGPTEATVGCTLYKYDLEEDNGIAVPIGVPASNMKIYILNKDNSPQPIGIPGELYISGDGLARGYINHPELTAEKFFKNPFVQGERIYKTGDLAKWLPDGNIEFLGRIDHQVKIRGYRIELGEIESFLLKHPGIKEAVVIAKEDGNGSKYLCAYIAGEKEFVLGELREHLSKELPDYMIPLYFVQLESIPLTPNGKLDRKALPEPNVSMMAGAEYEAPRNGIEEKLVKIWQEVLGVEKIGINDSFFELGGHSLKATSMAAKIHKELNVEVPLKEIFSTPTIKGLSGYIAVSKHSKYKAIEAVDERDYYPVSTAQNRLWILKQANDNDTSYNMTQIVSIEGKLDRKMVEAAFKKLIERHEILRTSFEHVNAMPVQKVNKDVKPDISYTEVKEGIDGIITSFIKPFDLKKAPLIRVLFIQIEKDRHIMAFDMHHIISDGLSMNIITKEFAELYQSRELPEQRIQYKDYCVWHNGLLESGTLKSQEEYWKKKLDNFIYSELPKKSATPQGKAKGTIKELKLDKETTERIKKYCKKANITQFTFMLGVFKLIISKYSGQKDITVGIPVAGRNYAELDNMIGLFLNVLIIRTVIKMDLSFGEYLNLVEENILGAQDNQDYPYEELYAHLKETINFNRPSIFSILFNYMPYQKVSYTFGGITIKPYEIDEISPKYDITLYLREADEISMSLVYKDNLYDEGVIRNILNSYSMLINTLLENDNVLIRQIDSGCGNAVKECAPSWDEYFNNSDLI